MQTDCKIVELKITDMKSSYEAKEETVFVKESGPKGKKYGEIHRKECGERRGKNKIKRPNQTMEETRGGKLLNINFT